MEVNRIIEELAQKITLKKESGNYFLFECPNCHKDAYLYLKAGYHSWLKCNHANNCGYSKQVKDILGKTFTEPAPQDGNGYLESFKKHGISLVGFDWLLGDLSHPTLKLNSESCKTLRWKEADKKYRWMATKGYSAEKGEFYPVLHDHGEKTLYVMAGEWDWLKAIEDGLACTSPLFGEKYIPKHDIGWEVFSLFDEIRIVYDMDPAGNHGAAKLGKALLEKFEDKRVGIVKLPFGEGEEGKDYCDYRTNHSLEEFRKIQPVFLKMRQSTRREGVLIGEYLQKFNDFGFKFSFNTLTDDLYINGNLAQEKDLAKVRMLFREWAIVDKRSISLAQVNDVMLDEASSNTFHPVKEYFKTLPIWDGKDRLAEILKSFPQANEDAHRWLEVWFAGAVRRVMENGHHFPVLVLISKKQGIGKSSFGRWLCPKQLEDLYIESLIRPEDKDNRLRLAATFIWEIQELGATTRRADVEALKGFLSTERIRDRKPYGSVDIVKPALACFLGTVNDNGAGFLLDTTGNRRFMVLDANEMNFSFQKIDINQVWAQAIVLWQQGKALLTTNDREKQEVVNDDYLINTPTDSYIEKFYEITGKEEDFVQITDISDDLKGVGINPSKATLMEIASYFKKFQEVKKDRKSIGKKQVRGYLGVRKSDSAWNTRKDNLDN